MTTKAVSEQPDPNGDGEVVLFELIKDLEDRAEFGKDKYGTYLRTDDGRDTFTDAYQEALDLVMYLKKLQMEIDNETS